MDKLVFNESFYLVLLMLLYTSAGQVESIYLLLWPLRTAVGLGLAGLATVVGSWCQRNEAKVADAIPRKTRL